MGGVLIRFQASDSIAVRYFVFKRYISALNNRRGKTVNFVRQGRRSRISIKNLGKPIKWGRIKEAGWEWLQTTPLALS